ncbi:hypothetical protein [Microbulbifer taiwanensis]|uniref:DUF4234 domain-containing protein n=2 Tax=Microbulbifer taiwanensis TaxID=986746 RepID=A0ABW1YP42_9GAMM
METDIYRAPEADLGEPEAGAAREFYVVSSPKFLILMIATFGLYELYWFYRNWSLYRMRHGVKILPVMRAIFSLIFVYSLFGKVASSIRHSGRDIKWYPGWMAASYILFSIIGLLADGLAGAVTHYTLLDLVSLALFPLFVWILYCAQQEINVACDDPQGESNAELTPANYLWILIGALIWAGLGFEYFTGFFGSPT